MQLLWVACADSDGHFVLLHALRTPVASSHTLASVLSTVPFDLMGRSLSLHKKWEGQT